MAKAVAAILLVTAACGGAKEAPDPPPGPPITLADADLNTAVLGADMTRTTEPLQATSTFAPTTTRYLQPVATTAPGPEIPLPYNGWAIPEYIVMCESRGNWNAINSSGASGPYQIMAAWFNGELAMNQPRSAQHAMAARIWNGGKGASNWAACL